MGQLQRIRQRILDESYLLSGHAEEEMYADELEEGDVVQAILHGQVSRSFTGDPRGTRYQVTGPALDGRLIHVVCRFHETGELIVITVYAEGSEL